MAQEGVEGVEKSHVQAKAKPRRRFVGASPKASSSKVPIRRVANQIPDDILHDPLLNGAIARVWNLTCDTPS